MKISFIIPAYNVEYYIGRCLDSILTQPFEDFEIIIINDGSTDNTLSVANGYGEQDPRILVFSQLNAGQGAARSFGISKACGDYIWFVDSDDWLIESVLVSISAILDKVAPDVMVINFEFAFDDKPATPSSLVPPHLVGEIINPRIDAGTFAVVSCWNTPPWRLISRRQHLVDNNIYFASGVFYEDHPFAIHLMLTASKVYVDGRVSYAYYQRGTSTTKVNDQKSFDFLAIRRQCLELFKQYGEYERFAAIVVGYIAPANFYVAHVAEPFRNEFISRLSDQLSDDEYAFVNQYGDWWTKLFVEAVKARNPSLMERKQRDDPLRNRYNIAGIKRFAKRIANGILRRVANLLIRLRTILFPVPQPVGMDTLCQRFLRVGAGTRVEAISIDVRVKQRDRPYVIVGDNSHIGGTFVFERGIGEVTIGNKTSIGGGCKIICTQEFGIRIGNNVMLAWNCTLMDTDAHSLNPEMRFNDAYDWKCGADAGQIGAYKDWSQVKSAPIVIEDGSWLGFETAVMKGVRIGRGAVIGARSLVTADVAPFCVYAGNPARFIRYVPRKKWTWEEIIHAYQGNPHVQQMLKEAYLHRDLEASLVRYRESGEFMETLVELRSYASKAKQILDVGGAGGVMAIALALEGYKVTMIEPSSDSIVGTAAAQKLVKITGDRYDSKIHERIRVVNSSIEDFVSTESFDIVYCRQVVHHFKDPINALRKIKKLLKADGIVFFVREHVIFDEEDKQAFYKSHPFHGYTGCEQAYRVDEYLDFIKKSGLDLVRSYRFSETLINCFPHDPEYCRSVDERDVAGRPYSFMARKPRASQS